MDEDEIIIMYYFLKRRKMKQAKKRKYWVHPMLLKRIPLGLCQSYIDELKSDDGKFCDYLRMTVATFHSLLARLGENLRRENTNFRNCISAEERLVITLRYWNRAPKTDDSDFVDGWFRTGDTASFAGGRFRILGRTSIDIIKTAGYKISALQVESAILEHDDVADAAVLGVPHESLGEIIAAVVSLKDASQKFTMRDLKAHLSKKIAPYQLPRSLLLVNEMPRNAMGKLDKKKIKELYGKELGFDRQKA